MPKLARVFLLCLLMSFSFAHPLFAETYRHPETGICLPDRLAGLLKLSFNNYEEKRAGLGVSVGYGAPDVTATIYLYNMGMKSIPEGIDASDFRTHFDQVVAEVIGAGQNGPYRDVKILSVEKALLDPGKDGPSALSATFTYVVLHSGKEVLSKLYLMGYKNHFLKIRFTGHMERRIEGEKALERFLQELSEIIK